MSRGLRWIGLLATALIVALLAYNIVREPARQEAARARFQARAIASGIDLYAAYCVECHGAAGEGLGVYRALNQEYVRRQDAWALFDTIERGRYGTEMAAFSLEQGGVLTPAQIDNLVALLQHGSWQVVQARVEELGLTPTEVAAQTASPDELAAVTASGLTGQEALALGLGLFAANCAECHGEQGEGTGDAPQLNNAYVRGMSTQQLFEIITLGVRNTDMEGFGEQFSPDEKAALIYLLRHWDTTGGSAVAAAPNPEPTVAVEGFSASGQQLFETWCAICHGVRGEGGSIAPSLNDIPALSADFITSRVRGGKNAMPPFAQADLSDGELGAIIAYAQQSVIGSALPRLSAEELTAAAELYARHCAECHGPQGEGAGEDGPPLVTSPPMRASEIVNFTRVGSAQTPPIPPSAVSDEELRLIVAYLHSLSR